MTKLEFATTIVQFLRKEPAAALVRFEILLILAANTDDDGRHLPMSSYQIMHMMGNSGPNGGTLSEMTDNLLLEASPGPVKGRVFKITNAGLHQVNDLLTGGKRLTNAPA